MTDPRALRTIERLTAARDRFRENARKGHTILQAGTIALALAIMIVEEEFECTTSSEKVSSTPLP
jgi:hypothetical protein